MARNGKKFHSTFTMTLLPLPLLSPQPSRHRRHRGWWWGRWTLCFLLLSLSRHPLRPNWILESTPDPSLTGDLARAWSFGWWKRECGEHAHDPNVAFVLQRTLIRESSAGQSFYSLRSKLRFNGPMKWFALISIHKINSAWLCNR